MTEISFHCLDQTAAFGMLFSSVPFPKDGSLKGRWARRYPFISHSISTVIRLRSSTSMPASNGRVPCHPDSPIKYWRYSFFVIGSTSSLLGNRNLLRITKEASAMRNGFVTLPVSLGNRPAYFSSNKSHRILSAIWIQRLSGFAYNSMG